MSARPDVERLYQLALDLPPADRGAFLARECAGDVELENQVRELLAAYEAAPADFLQTTNPLWTRGGPPESIGPYQLREVLGEGGMGIVFRAEQDAPVQRTVALKIVKLGMDSREVLARFESERQVLAELEHPNIARVYDAGTTPDGRPFFAMEYVGGAPITEYCDANRLTPKERVQLLIDVCRGVQYAHQHGIIHRDLKPTNILVHASDGVRTPKIIDFGVAKATSREINERTLYTQFGMPIGTPEYMSPEQAAGTTVDTRSDVYSLGVVLYELLAGSLPLDAVALREAGFEGMMRMIREQEPPRPSTRVSTLGESARTTATHRRTRLRTLIRDLRGELDWIAMRALEKDRERRYSTVAALAADLEAHLRDEPIQARPDSAWYVMRKFTKRNRVAVGFVMIIVLASFAVATTMTVQANRVARERDRANREAQIAGEVKSFLTELFEVSDPAVGRGAEVTARELLDEARTRLDTIEEPQVRAELAGIMGRVYSQMGLFEEAQALSENAYETWLATEGPDRPNTVHAIMERGVVAQQLGQFATAESLYVASQQGWRRLGLEEDVRALDVEVNLGIVARQQGRYDLAEERLLAVLPRQKAAVGDEDPTVLRIQTHRAMLKRRQGRPEEAAQLYEEVLPILRRVQGDDHPQTLGCMDGLAWVYTEMERYEEARVLLEESVETTRRVRGPDHPDLFVTIDGLAYWYFQREELAKARPLFEETLEGRLRTQGPEHPSTLVSRNNLAALVSAEGDYQRAIQLHLENLAVRRRVEGDDHPMTNGTRVNLSVCHAHLGEMEPALEYLRDAVDRGWYEPFFLREVVQGLYAPLFGDPEYERLAGIIRERLESD